MSCILIMCLPPCSQYHEWVCCSPHKPLLPNAPFLASSAAGRLNAGVQCVCSKTPIGSALKLYTHSLDMAQGAVMQACGHMYLDEGEELSTGAARDNLLAFSAYTVAGGNGTGQVSNLTALLSLLSQRNNARFPVE